MKGSVSCCVSERQVVKTEGEDETQLSMYTENDDQQQRKKKRRRRQRKSKRKRR